MKMIVDLLEEVIALLKGSEKEKPKEVPENDTYATKDTDLDEKPVTEVVVNETVGNDIFPNVAVAEVKDDYETRLAEALKILKGVN